MHGDQDGDGRCIFPDISEIYCSGATQLELETKVILRFEKISQLRQPTRPLWPYDYDLCVGVPSHLLKYHGLTPV